jgi:hypothetical protein
MYVVKMRDGALLECSTPGAVLGLLRCGRAARLESGDRERLQRVLAEQEGNLARALREEVSHD